MILDLIVDNATVVTMDTARPRASSVAIAGERILAVGDAGEFTALRARRRLDLAGLTVLPAFNDAHNHMRGFGEMLGETILTSPPMTCIQDILDALAAADGDTPGDGWIIGSGYDHNKLAERRHPTRFELDRAVPGRPVLINHTSGHFCVANSRALATARIGEVAVPAGGVVDTDEQGVPSGLLEEQAQSLVRNLLDPLSIDTMAAQIGAAGEHYLTEGIASCQEAGIGCLLGGRHPLELAAYQLARARKQLRVRVTLMVGVENLHPVAGHADIPDAQTLDLGLHTGFGDDWLRIGAAKVFADGSLLGRTAAMFEEFEGEPGNCGYLLMDESRLHDTIFKAHCAGWQIATHAIGDRAVATTIDVYQDVLRRVPRADHRHRIEHCGMCRTSDLARIAETGLIPVPQARFISEIGDGMLAAVGPRRSPDCYRQRSFLDAGVVLSGSSDRPVVKGAPLLGIHDLVNQRTASGHPFNPREALTAEEALRAYTLGSAYAAFDEQRKGSVSPGKLADLVILDTDPTTCDPEAIAGIGVLGTMVGGQLAFDAAGFE